jgi:hypothetical protein
LNCACHVSVANFEPQPRHDEHRAARTAHGIGSMEDSGHTRTSSNAPETRLLQCGENCGADSIPVFPDISAESLGFPLGGGCGKP